MHWLILILVGLILYVLFLVSQILILVAFLCLLCLPYALCSIPYHKVAKQNKIRHAWLVFLPFAKNFILLQFTDKPFALPAKKYIKKRTAVYWLQFFFSIAIPLFYAITFIFCGFVTTLLLTPLLLSSPDEYLGVSEIPVVSFIFWGIAIIGTLIFCTFMIYTNWRIYYDILSAYCKHNTAAIASAFNVFIPFIVPMFILCYT